MIKLNYNFAPADLPDWSPQSIENLFQQKRRDAIFAYAVQNGRYLYAVRDHLGTVPIFWRHDHSGVRCATNLSDLACAGDRLRNEGVVAYLSFGSAKIIPLLHEIEMVPPGTAVCIDTQTGGTKIIYQHQFKPQQIPIFTPAKTIIERGEELFVQAIQRQIKAEQVGLFLSGGIDSSLIGIYLKKAGIRIHAYTAALWGRSSSEIPFAKINAKTIGTDRHHIAYLESDQYARLNQSLPAFYKGPHGTTTALGIRFLWETGQLDREAQLFFGQNSDTMTCSVGQQFHAYLLGQLPLPVRRGLSKLLPRQPMLARLTQRNLVHNYLSLVSEGVWTSEIDLPVMARINGRSLPNITLAGMLVAHTPSDGEVMAQPAINRQQPISNPYYDVDLIEYCLGLPLWYRLGLTEESKFKVGLKKRLFQDIASKHLPPSLVARKKAFLVPMERDSQTRRLFDAQPDQFGGLTIKPNMQRFAAGMLQQWCTQHQIMIGAFNTDGFEHG